MKWIKPLGGDPVGWSEKVAKTKMRVLSWTLIHFCFVAAGFLTIYWFFHAFDDLRESRGFSLVALLSGAAPILFVGVVYPALYLYALHRLLGLLTVQGKVEATKTQAS
jgi:hypothetical protein